MLRFKGEDISGVGADDSLDAEFEAMPVEAAPKEDAALARLLKQRQEAEDKKGWINAAGSVLQGIADVPTGYEMMYNKKLGNSRPAEALSKVAGSIEDPAEKAKKAYEFIKQKKEVGQMRDQDAMGAENKRVDSNISKAKKAMATKYGISVTPEMTGHDIDQLLDAKKMNEVEAQSVVNHETRMKELEFSKDADLKKYKIEAGFRAQDKKDAKAVKDADERKERTTTFGVARTNDDAKNLKAAAEIKSNFDSKLQEMIDLRKKHGGGQILNRDDQARAKALSDDLLLAYKDLSKLGVMSKTDEAILRRIIPSDPLQYNSPLAAARGEDPTMNQMKKFKADTEADFQTRLKQRLEDGQAPPRDPEAEQYAKQHGISYEQAVNVKAQRMSNIGKR
jgi:hypothetical protein